MKRLFIILLLTHYFISAFSQMDTVYYENGQPCSKEKYSNDDFKRGKFWDEQGNRTTSDKFIKEAEYPGGIDAFKKPVTEN